MEFRLSLFSLAFIIAVFVFVATSSLPVDVYAQSAANSGQIVGQVMDPSKAALTNVPVKVRNKDTSYERIVTTDGAGRYAVTQLPLGPYEVTVNATGLEAGVREVSLTLGSTITANFELGLQPVTETTQVTAQALTTEPSRSAPKSILTDLQIHNLPSNGRRIQNIVTQTPATLIEPECSGFSVSGQKGIYANVSIDGGDYDSTFQCGVRARSSSAPSFGFEALQEVQVVRNAFSPEFGRSTGGVITMSTRSGTNQFHGTGLYLGRDGSMTANDAFGRPSISTVHQFGGSFGGPIKEGRTFFFIAPEFQQGSKAIQVVYPGLDPTTAAGQALLAIAPQEQLNAVSNGKSVISRIDHRFSDANSMFGRFDFTRTYTANSPGATAQQTGLGIASTANTSKSNLLLTPASNYTSLVQWNTVLSTSLLNEARVGFSREVRPRTYQGDGPQVTIGNTAVYGPPSSGSWGNVGFASEDNRYQLTDNFSIVNGSHTTKVGFDFLRAAGHALYNQQFNGAYSFSSLTNWLNRTPTSYTQFTGTGDINLAINQLALYVQHEWRIRPGLTVTPGFRYDGQWNPDYFTATTPTMRFPGATSIPDDAAMLAPRLGFAWDIGNDGKMVLRGGGGLFYAPTYMSLFAQSMLFNGGNPDKAFAISITDPTALRNAFAATGVNLATAPLANLPTFTPAQAYQLFGAPTTANNTAPFYIDPNFKNPHAQQFQLALERELATGITANVTWARIHTVDLSAQRDVNLGTFWVDATGRAHYNDPNNPTSAATVRPFGPTFAKVQETTAVGHSMYNGITTALNMRRSRYTVDLYYTRSWNYTLDDTERGFTGITYADVNDIASEYNYSNIDEPHVFLANVNYNLPFGLDVASSMKFTSGRPFTAKAGTTDLNQDGNTNDRPIVDGVMFQRNTFRNAGYKDVSLRVQKNFATRAGSLSLSLEAFNLFNFANVQLGSAQMVYGAGTALQTVNGKATVVAVPVPSTFMQYKDANGNHITTNGNTAGDARTIQLGVRFQF